MNEICLSCDHNTFIGAHTDDDAHNPLTCSHYLLICLRKKLAIIFLQLRTWRQKLRGRRMMMLMMMMSWRWLCGDGDGGDDGDDGDGDDDGDDGDDDGDDDDEDDDDDVE